MTSSVRSIPPSPLSSVVISEATPLPPRWWRNMWMSPFRRNIAMPFGMEKLEWLPEGEKHLKICLFFLTESTKVTDRQTDTAWRLRPRLNSIARQKSAFCCSARLAQQASIPAQRMCTISTSLGSKSNHFAWRTDRERRTARQTHACNSQKTIPISWRQPGAGKTVWYGIVGFNVPLDT